MLDYVWFSDGVRESLQLVAMFIRSYEGISPARAAPVAPTVSRF